MIEELRHAAPGAAFLTRPAANAENGAFGNLLDAVREQRNLETGRAAAAQPGAAAMRPDGTQRGGADSDTALETKRMIGNQDDAAKSERMTRSRRQVDREIENKVRNQRTQAALLARDAGSAQLTDRRNAERKNLEVSAAAARDADASAASGPSAAMSGSNRSAAPRTPDGKVTGQRTAPKSASEDKQSADERLEGASKQAVSIPAAAPGAPAIGAAPIASAPIATALAASAPAGAMSSAPSPAETPASETTAPSSTGTQAAKLIRDTQAGPSSAQQPALPGSLPPVDRFPDLGIDNQGIATQTAIRPASARAIPADAGIGPNGSRALEPEASKLPFGTVVASVAEAVAGQAPRPSKGHGATAVVSSRDPAAPTPAQAGRALPGTTTAIEWRDQSARLDAEAVRPGSQDARTQASQLLDAIAEMRGATAGAATSEAPASANLGFAAQLMQANATPTPASSVAPAPARLENPWPLHEPAFQEHLAGQVSDALLSGIDRAEITLSPRELGPIRIELSLSGESASIAFSATQPDTRAAIEQSLPLLRAMLAEHGLQLAQASVNGSATDASTSGRSNQESGSRGQPGGQSQPSIGSTASGQPPIRRPAPPQGLLDLFA